MVEHLIVSELFESEAIGLAGPLPKGKGGARFILVFVCLTSSWPEAVPVSTGYSYEVAEGLFLILSSSGFPDAFRVMMVVVCVFVCVCVWIQL